MNPDFELSIEFLTKRRADRDHPRHRYLQPLERKLERIGFDFAIYRELFERYIGEGLIATGGGSREVKGLVEIREVAIGPKGFSEINPIEDSLGIHSRHEARYSNLSNFFEQYDKISPELFFKNKVYLDTLYFRNEILPQSERLFTRSVYLLSSLTGQDPFERIARERVAMLENFRNSGGRLVSNSRSGQPGDRLRYFDLPWAIDYFGYVKERDGAHRRATMWYLRQLSIPTLVLDFSQIDSELCANATDTKLLTENFPKFRVMVQDIVRPDPRL